MEDYIRMMINKRKEGDIYGMPSFCCANPIVIKTCLELGKRERHPVLIEATANQVNQFGGYTGMKPVDFRDMVYAIADEVGFEREMLILGGDHLGPLIWAEMPEDAAMDNAKELVKAYVEAGFKKIHLDTSMRLGSDDIREPLTDATIARRGASLYAVCEKAYQSLRAVNPNEQRPCYIIGSEVPVPGGAQEKESRIEVTKPESLRNTLDAYKKEFDTQGFPAAFENIVGIVVQPGVEFGDDSYFCYDRLAAQALVAESKKYCGIVLEGHSTDYQPLDALREMVEDGIAILKVGPALTFALREALFALSMMEKEMVPAAKQAYFPETLETAMLDAPQKWEKYYHGSASAKFVHRRYSYSDRCRYYLTVPEVNEAAEKLLDTMNGVELPMGMLHQFMPVQYEKISAGLLEARADSLVMDYVAEVAERYNHAAKLS